MKTKARIKKAINLLKEQANTTKDINIKCQNWDKINALEWVLEDE